MERQKIPVMKVPVKDGLLLKYVENKLASLFFFLYTSTYPSYFTFHTAYDFFSRELLYSVFIFFKEIRK